MRPTRITVVAVLCLAAAAAACGITAVGTKATDDLPDGAASSSSSGSSSSSSSSGGGGADGDVDPDASAGDASSDAPADAIVDAPSDAPVLVPPYLILTHAPASASNDLTADGTTEWAHWGYQGNTGSVRKANTTDVISLLNRTIMVSGSFANSTGFGANVTWSDGETGTETGTSDYWSGLTLGSTQSFCQVRAPSGPTKRTFIVYVGGVNMQGRMSASLSGTTVTAVDTSYANLNGTIAVRYVAEYATLTASEVVMRWSAEAIGGSGGELRFSSAALR